MYEMYSRGYPYQGEDPIVVLDQLRDKTTKKRPPYPATMSPTVKQMMRDCLHPKPKSRPSLDELVARVDRLQLGDAEYQTTTSNSIGAVQFPSNVAKALSKGHAVDPQTHENVTVFYAEIVGFAELSSQMPPVKVADLLERLNEKLDGLAYLHMVFKVDMTGAGAVMAATNCIQHQPSDHVQRIAAFAIDTVKAAGSTAIDEDNIDSGCVVLRAAFVTGQVTGKVVGGRKPRYSLSGPAVEAVTHLVEEKSEPGQLICAESEQGILQQKCPEITTELKSRIVINGMGAQLTYFVKGKATRTGNLVMMGKDQKLLNNSINWEE